MTTQFFCTNKIRWKKISESKIINGIDYLEIASLDQKTITVFFIHPLPGQPGGIPDGSLAIPPADLTLTKDNVFISGGTRVKNIKVVSIATGDKKLTVTVDKTGDFSDYVLKIGNSPTDTDTPPPGFDQQLSSIRFSFKINCPTEFDCRNDVVCLPDTGDELDPNYLAKDYASFNRLMLDRLSVIMPGWKERNAADLQIALVELLAYMGDHLSYYQDAVATEAYLSTARRRISLKRLARLLDYYAHDGCNARTWVHIEAANSGAADGLVIPEGTAVLTNGTDNTSSVPETDMDRFILDRDPVVFETMHRLQLYSAHNSISFYTWADDNCCLPEGATRATLLNKPALSLKKGDVLVFEEIYSPSSGKKADADPACRHAVRLTSVKEETDQLTNEPVLTIEWHDEDALPFSLVLSTTASNEDSGTNEKSIARGNIVLADHGMTQKKKQLIPATFTGDTSYYPLLPEKNISVSVAYDKETEKANAASLAIVQDPHQALPVVTLTGNQEVWEARKDLLGSDRFATEFVVETEQNGSSYLRFGNDQLGKRPLKNSEMQVSYRVGNGKEGNIGPEAINTIIWKAGFISKVRNPLPASGATDPETMEEIRQFAPQAFRKQARAVTTADYAEKTELHHEVQKAAARFRWTGSWYTVFISIDRKAGKEVDDAFRQEIMHHLEQYRMACYDLEINGPQFVPLSITLNVCVKQEYFNSNVKKSLIQVFSNDDSGDGTKGFFHPDNFTFGQPVYLSAIYQMAMSVQGVASVEIQEFRRWAKNDASEISKGLLQPSELEIIRLDNDPDFPENGKINFILFGGK